MTARSTVQGNAEPKRFKTADGTAHLAAAAAAAKGVLDLVSGLQGVPHPLLYTLLSLRPAILKPAQSKPRATILFKLLQFSAGWHSSKRLPPVGWEAQRCRQRRSVPSARPRWPCPSACRRPAHNRKHQILWFLYSRGLTALNQTNK